MPAASTTSCHSNLGSIAGHALVIAPDAMFISRSEQLGAFTLRHAVPAVTQFREFATAGGLMSYGGSFTEPTRLVGVYTGRVLKGEKLADLPVMQATKLSAGHQSQDRQGARPQRPKYANWARGRGDRIKVSLLWRQAYRVNGKQKSRPGTERGTRAYSCRHGTGAIRSERKQAQAYAPSDALGAPAHVLRP